MTISSYSDLVTAVENWSGQGTTLASRIPEGIVLCEAKMNRYMRVKDMVSKNASFSITGEYVAVPTTFGGVKTFYLNSAGTPNLEYMPDEQITASYQGQSGTPKYYDVQGANFRFAPIPQTSVTATLVYYLLVPALTSGATTNWVILSHPDAYLYGVLAEMAVLNQNADAAQGFWTLMYQALDQIKLQSDRDRVSRGPLTTRVDSSTP